MFPRAVIVRVAVYLMALLVVIWLLRTWDRPGPSDRMTVIEVHQADRWETQLAGPREKYLIVRVQLETDPGDLQHWGPDLFRLEDEAGRRYRPLDDSPLLKNLPHDEAARPVVGDLLFRMPASARGRSLSLLPEGWDHADSTDHQSEDIGPQSGP
jgi:hypothetical protein